MTTGEVGAALKRKFGPLPAWAWAGIGGGALYFYRRSKSGAGVLGAANVPAASSPDVTDQSGGLQSPLSLAPGESVYDPNTGQLLSPPLPPEVGSSDGGGDTGAGGAAPAPAPSSPKAKKPKAGGKRKQKPKPKHPGKAAAPTHGKTRSRLGAAIRGKRAAPATGHPARMPASSKPRHATPAAHTPASPGRGRATPPARIALRQRPTAPKVVNHAEQRVQAHPEAPPRAAARAPVAAPKPRPAPARAPARRRP